TEPAIASALREKQERWVPPGDSLLIALGHPSRAALATKPPGNRQMVAGALRFGSTVGGSRPRTTDRAVDREQLRCHLRRLPFQRQAIEKVTASAYGPLSRSAPH